MVVTIVVLGLVLVAAVTDLARHRIYNRTTYPGILAALGLNALGELAAWRGADPVWLARMGWIGLGASVFGLALLGLLMLVCFVLFKVGGGDVKLMAMVGGFLGPQRGLEALLWTFALGAAVALIVLVWRVGAWRLVVRLVRQMLYVFRLGGWARLTPDERSQLQAPLFLAPSALAAVAIVQFSLAERLPAWI
jgi:prepilin peptidase CpaA